MYNSRLISYIKVGAMLEKFFKLKEHNTSIKTELFAGITIFLAMVYIIPVGSSILHIAGMPKDSLITSIALVSAMATLATGLYANAPVGMSVGMGLNVYFSFSLVQGLGLSWQEALAIVFLSGLIFLILSFTKFRIYILNSIPKDLRYSLCVGLGAFLASIGLNGLGLLHFTSDGVFLGSLGKSAVVGIIGIFIILFLEGIKLKSSFIVGILIISAIAWAVGLGTMPSKLISMPASIAPIALQIDLLSVLKISMIAPIIAVLITHLFDSIGTLGGIGIKANMFQDINDKKLSKTLQVDAASATVGSLFGLSTITAFLESATGVNNGARTGLSACFCALLFLLAIFFMPLFNAIPKEAIYPVLIVVGALMFSEIKNINFKKFEISIASFFTIVLMPLTTSITNGLCAGIISFVVLSVFLRKWENINFGVFAIFIISFIPFIL